jgi:hypothetical protein
VDTQGNAQAVGNFAVPGQVNSLHWSPVSDQIALSSWGSYYTAVSVYSSAGASIAQFEGYQFAWSQDGTQLAIGDDIGHLVVGTLASDTVTAPIESDYVQSPGWAPAGDNRISFLDYSNNGSNFDPQLIVRSVPGAGSSRFVVADQVQGYAWSPDGTQIAYQTQVPSSNYYYYYTSCDLDVAQLTSVGVTASTPLVHGTNCQAAVAWSPDSSRLGVGQDNLFIVPVNAQPIDYASLTGLMPPGSNNYYDVSSLAWTPDGQNLAFTWPSGTSYYGYYGYYYVSSTDFLLEPVGGGAPLPVLSGLGGSAFDLR